MFEAIASQDFRGTLDRISHPTFFIHVIGATQ